MDQKLSSNRNGSDRDRGRFNNNKPFQKRRYDNNSGGGQDNHSNYNSNNNRRQRSDSGGKWVDRRDYRSGGGEGGYEDRGSGSRGGDGRGGGGRGYDRRGGGRDNIAGSGRDGGRGGGGREDRDGRGPPPSRDGRGHGSQQQQGYQQQQGGGYSRNQHQQPRSNNYPPRSQIPPPPPPGPPPPLPPPPQQPQQSEHEKANTPIPTEQRRTLILSNIPPHFKYSHLQSFFLQHWNAYVQYALLERKTGEAYVRFKRVEDARRVWDGGNIGLDGCVVQQQSNSSGGVGGEGDGSEISLVKLGVELKAIHFTNYMIDSRKQDDFSREHPGERGAGGDRKRGWNDYQDRGNNWREDPQQLDRGGYSSGGYSSGGQPHHGHHSQHQQSKMPRYEKDSQHYNDQYYDPSQQSQQHGHPTPTSNAPPNAHNAGGYNDQYHDVSSQQQQRTPASATSTHSTPATNPTNNSYRRTPTKTKPPTTTLTPLSPMEIQLQQQKQAEEDAAWEAFQKLESAWRQRRQAEYDAHITAKNARLTQLSTLEQKLTLLQKQESSLNQQLSLHKKMLAMLKSKDASKAEQSKKMKEILEKQKKVMELKKERMALLGKMEKMKEEEKVKGRFMPSEKRPVFLGVGGGDGVSGGGGDALQGSGGGGGIGIESNVPGSGVKRSLDRRTTILKVVGFDNDDVTEDAIKEHFATFGTVKSVTIKQSNGNDETDEAAAATPKVYALVNFENRIEAEWAKSSGATLNDTTLTCSWYNNPSTTSTPNKEDDTNEQPMDDDDGDGGLYGDVGDGDIFGGDVFGEEAGGGVAQDDEENVDYDYEEDEDVMVDYD